MRNSDWLVTCLLVLECVVLLLIEPSECFLNFIPVSVSTALQILTMLVKIKSIIFKILLGLKLMGVEGFIMRRRRRSINYVDDEFNYITTHWDDGYPSTSSKSYLDWKLKELPVEQRTELLMAWRRLERLLGQSIQFDERACVQAVQRYGRKPITIWDGPRFNTPDYSSDWRTIGTRVSRSTSYWISKVLGSALGSPYACHILERQVNYSRPIDILTNSHYFRGSSSSSSRRASSPYLTLSSSVLGESNKSVLVENDTGAFS